MQRLVCILVCLLIIVPCAAEDGENIRLAFSQQRLYRTPLLPDNDNQSVVNDTVGEGRLFGIFINTTLYWQITESIDTYISDLESEGWQVVLYTIEGGTSNKSDPNSWATEDFICELEAARQVRELLKNEHNQGMVGCTLIGELPAGWVEAQAGSGTGSPVDLFFRDLDSHWDDIDENGLLDENFSTEGDCKPEIWMSRLYASSLDGDEVSLMINYFRKNHAYRIGELTLPKRALDYVDDDWISAGFFLRGLYDEITQVNDSQITTATDYLAKLSEGYDLIRVTVHGFGCGHSFFNNDNRSNVFYWDINDNDPSCFFYDIVSCGTFEWWNTNYIDGWYVFSPSYGLASWGLSQYGSASFFYDALDRGKCLGEAQFERISRWVTDKSYLGGDNFGDFGMFGDPTLVLRQSHSRPTIIYVDYDVVGEGNGLNWENAYNSLQDALSAASWGTEIHVAQGTYWPDQGAAVSLDDRSATFRLRNGVVIKGGYAGFGAPDPNMRDVNLYKTILSGDIGIPDVNSDNTYHIVTANLVGAAVVLDGFTITGSYADGNDVNRCGGGIYMSRSCPNIVDCFIINNYAEYGGGMFIEDDSMPTLINCQFNHNSAIDAAGMANKHYSNPTLNNCIFSVNEARSTAGGMRNLDNCNPFLTNCTFSNNRSNEGSGMFNKDSSSPILNDCYFSENESNSTGGGMHNINCCDPVLTNCTFWDNWSNDGAGMFNKQYSNPTLNNCKFSDNSSKNGGGMSNYLYSQPILASCEFYTNSATLGGGMFNDRASPILTNCKFSENQAETHGGGMYNRAYCETLLINCTFTKNTADRYGGGIYNYFSNPSLTNCIISGNSAVSYGGGLYNVASNSILTNCTISGNSAVAGGAVFNQSSRPSLTNCILWGDKPHEIYDYGDSVTVVSYSDIEGGWPGETNINLYPNFINANNGDFHLKSQSGRWSRARQRWVYDSKSSRCIDAGDPNTPVGDEQMPNGGRINMGAYGGTSQASKSEN